MKFKEWITQHNIVLASKSPRRAELLRLMDIPFRILTCDTDESYDEALKAKEIPIYIAQQKALAVRSHYRIENEIIIGADSIVFLNDDIMGKPTNAKEAYRMLAKLSGKKHTVTTGVCILFNQRVIKFASSSEVLMRPLDHDEVNYYIDTYQPYDKAGGYAIQEWIGMNKISHIEGSYTNIMGLPTDLVYEALKGLMSDA